MDKLNRPGSERLSRLLKARDPHLEPKPFDPGLLEREPRIDLSLEAIGTSLMKEESFRLLPAVWGSIAALVFILPVAYLLFDHGVSDPDGPIETSTVVLFKVGSAMVNGRELAVGEVVKGDALIKTGEQSLCDLQVRESSGLLIRLQAKSEFRLVGFREKKKKILQSDLRLGGAQWRVDRRSADEEVIVTTPVSVAGVRGTRFEIMAAADKSEIQVLEGTVASRIALTEITDLPRQIVKGSELLQAVEGVLVESETVMEKGEGTVNERKLVAEIFAAAPDLKAALSKDVVATNRGKSTVKDAAATLAIESLQKSYPDDASVAALLSKIRSVIKKSPKSVMPADEMQRRLKEYDELIAINVNTLKNAEKIEGEVRAANQKRRDELMKQIEKVMDKQSETLVLKDGTRLQGVVLLDGNNYTLLTPEGRQTYPADKVEGVDF